MTRHGAMQNDAMQNGAMQNDKMRNDALRKSKVQEKKATCKTARQSSRSKIAVYSYIFFNFSAGSEFVDQDSLDGQLPSSSRSLVHNDPSGITPSPTALAAPPPAPPPMNFTKGPGAQKKRHRKLNPETEDTMSDDSDSGGPPTPPAKSNR